MASGSTTLHNDTCTVCSCINGSVTCAPQQCPEPTCDRPTRDTCCLTCDNGCDVDGRRYVEGAEIASDHPCATCTCRDGSVACETPQCPEPTCEHPTRGTCCLTCDAGCAVRGRNYGEGAEIVSDDPCATCTCTAGEMTIISLATDCWSFALLYLILTSGISHQVKL